MKKKEKDIYGNFRNWITFPEDFERGLKDSWEKDSMVGRMIQVMDLIKKLDKENEKIKKIKQTIEKTEKQLKPLIQSVLEGEEMTRARDHAISYAEELVERYERYIKGYEELEKHYNKGRILSANHMVEFYEVNINDSSNAEIGTINEGVFQIISKKEFLKNIEKYSFNLSCFVRTTSNSNPEDYQISAFLGFAPNNEEQSDDYQILCFNSSESLISEAFPTMKDIFGED